MEFIGHKRNKKLDTRQGILYMADYTILNLKVPRILTCQSTCLVFSLLYIPQFLIWDYVYSIEKQQQ